jgi:hypothetical protein
LVGFGAMFFLSGWGLHLGCTQNTRDQTWDFSEAGRWAGRILKFLLWMEGLSGFDLDRMDRVDRIFYPATIVHYPPTTLLYFKDQPPLKHNSPPQFLTHRAFDTIYFFHESL